MARVRTTVVETSDVDGKAPLGVPAGTQFTWGTSLFYDSDKRSGGQTLYDGADLEAREISKMLGHYWQAKALDQVLTLPMRAAQWTLTPGKGDTGEAADTLERLQRPHHQGGMRTPIQTVIGQATSCVLYRRAHFGKGFKVDPLNPKRLLYSDIAFRPAETCHLLPAPDGSFGGFSQERINGGVTRRGDLGPVLFPPKKAVVFINGQHREPVKGVSDLDVALQCWVTIQKLVFLWAEFCAGAAQPRTVIRSTGSDDGVLKSFVRAVAGIKGSGVVGAPSSIAGIDTIDVAGSAAGAFQSLASFLDGAASKSCLASFMDMASGATQHGGGAYALYQGDSDFFLMSRQAVLDELGSTFTEQVVAPLVRYNFGPKAVVPTFKFKPLSQRDMNPVMELLGQVAASPTGGLPPAFVEEVVVRAADYLGMDADKVRASVLQQQSDAEAAAKAAQQPPIVQQVAGATAAVNAVGRMVQAKKAAPVKAPGRRLAKAVAKVTGPRKAVGQK